MSNPHKINPETLTAGERQLRQNIRNLFFPCTRAEIEAAMPHYPDEFSKRCLRELAEEARQEESR